MAGRLAVRAAAAVTVGRTRRDPLRRHAPRKRAASSSSKGTSRLVGARSGTDNGWLRRRRRGSAGHGVATALTPVGSTTALFFYPARCAAGLDFCSREHPTRFPSAAPRHGGGLGLVDQD